MYLYWVTTEYHEEDWFVVASSAEKASKFHEDNEGYNSGDAFAEEIIKIPESTPSKTGWPTDEILQAVGAQFLKNEATRIVEIEGRKFCEGLMEEYLNELNDDVFEEMGYKRLNKTKMSH